MKNYKYLLAGIITLCVFSISACTNTPWVSAPPDTPGSSTQLSPIVSLSPSPTQTSILSATRSTVFSPDKSPSPSLSLSASPSPAPMIAAGKRPFLPINTFQITDDQSVYYVVDSSRIFRRDIAGKKGKEIIGYDSPIHQMFVDYQHNLYYSVCGYMDNIDEVSGRLYRYCNGEHALLLKNIEYVCGINDRYLYYLQKTSFYDYGYYIDEIYSYDLLSAERSLLFSVQATFSDWAGYFSSGRYIYCWLKDELYSYDTVSGIREKLFGSDCLVWHPDTMDSNLVYVSGINNQPDQYVIYNLNTQKIEKVYVRLPFTSQDTVPRFYIDETFLYTIEYSDSTAKSTIRKIDIESAEILNEISMTGNVESAIIHNKKWYLYSDQIDEEYNITDKKLSVYDFVSGSIKTLNKYHKNWPSNNGDNVVRYMDVAGGSVYGYCLLEGDNGYYYLCFEEQVEKLK